MANDVFANSMEVSCKAASGKSMCAFPDVCFTPPQTPATPPGVPVPYPNTGMASDCTNGSRTVRISRKEVMLKNKSYFKRSTGDEAGCAPKKGVISSRNMGKVYFTKWSMDVKVEGENVVRHFDLATHNHASQGPNTPPWMYLDSMEVPPTDHPCKEQIEDAQRSCADAKPRTKAGTKDPDGRDCTDGCKKSMQCILVPKSEDKRLCCSPETTGHHLIEDHWVAGPNNELNASHWYKSGRHGDSLRLSAADRQSGKRTEEDAPTVCANRPRARGTTHRDLHNIQGAHEESHMPGGSRENEPWNYAAGKAAALEAHKEVFDNDKCHKNGCIEKQLDAFYGSDGSKKLNPPSKQGLGEDLRPGLLSKYGKKA